MTLILMVVEAVHIHAHLCTVYTFYYVLQFKFKMDYKYFFVQLDTKVMLHSWFGTAACTRLAPGP